MKNLVVLIAIGAIAVVCVIAFLLPERKADDAERGEEILPGIRFEFTNDRDAGEYYGKMIRGFLTRKTGAENPTNLTEEERMWFMLGTSCRKCNLYPEQFPHIMPYALVPELNAAKDIGQIMSRSARALWRKRRDKEALDIVRRVAVLGWHLEGQDEHLMSNMVGIIIQWVAYETLSDLHESRADTEMAEQYRGYVESRKRSLAPQREVSRPIKTLQDFEWFKSTALTHGDRLWRKMACYGLTGPFVRNNPQTRAQAVQVLRTVWQNDSDPVVRQFAAECIPCVTGQKRIPE